MKLFEKTEVKQEDFARLSKKILTDMAELLAKKNADYGGASMDMGMTGNYVHIHDKVSRLRSLLEKQVQGTLPNFEGIDDTLRDLIGYATIGLIINAFGSPSLPISPPAAYEYASFWDQARTQYRALLTEVYDEGNTPPEVFADFLNKDLVKFLKTAKTKYAKEVQDLLLLREII